MGRRKQKNIDLSPYFYKLYNATISSDEFGNVLKRRRNVSKLTDLGKKDLKLIQAYSEFYAKACLFPGKVTQEEVKKILERIDRELIQEAEEAFPSVAETTEMPEHIKNVSERNKEQMELIENEKRTDHEE